MVGDYSLEFDCTDCGLHIISIGPRHNPERRCAGCQWLAELPDSPDKPVLRQHLLDTGVIG
jgi:hypothetical protein